MKDRSPAGHSMRMRAFSSIEITLGVGLTLLTICAARHASAACRPGVRLDGDAALVGAVGAALGERGIATDGASDASGDPAGAPACAPARVTLARREDRIAVSIAGARELAVEREVTDARTATTVIESWVRTDVGEPLLASRTVAMAAPPRAAAPAPPPAPVTTTIVAPPAANGRGVQLFAMAERSLASDGTAWLGLQLGGCVSLGPFCVGGRGRFSIATGPQLRQDNLERHGFELLADADLPLRFGPAILSPGLGVGVGSVHTYQKGTGQSEGTGGPHADAHVSLAYQLRPHLALEVAMSVDVTETAHVESSAAAMLPDEPQFFARFGAGVRFGGL